MAKKIHRRVQSDVIDRGQLVERCSLHSASAPRMKNNKTTNLKRSKSVKRFKKKKQKIKEQEKKLLFCSSLLFFFFLYFLFFVSFFLLLFFLVVVL